MALTTIQGGADNQLQVSMQTSLFGGAPIEFPPVTQAFESLDAHSRVLFEPGWVRGSDQLFELLRDEAPWRATERPMYDRIVAVPRLICTYDLDTVDPTHPLVVMRGALETTFQARFQHVGLNYYRDGQDSVAWHRNRVHGHRHASTVALVSLGSPRQLNVRRFRPPRRTPGENAAIATISPSATRATRRRWSLGHGDLLIMTGACQRDWEHGVPKQGNVGPRISLAFRASQTVGGPRNLNAGVPPL